VHHEFHSCQDGEKKRQRPAAAGAVEIDRRERERQQEAGGDAAVESPNEQTAKRWMRTDGFADGAGRLQRRANRGDR
jgi:hypothetical protein